MASNSSLGVESVTDSMAWVTISKDENETDKENLCSEVDTAAGTPRSERLKEKKKRHERDRKARRKAEQRAADASKSPEVSAPPKWVTEAREQAVVDMEERHAENNHAGRCALRILPGITTPGIAAFIPNVLAREAGPAATPKELEAKVKHAVTYGFKGEADIIATADQNYVDDLARYASRKSPLARIPPTVEGSELATFRRCWPVGTPADKWPLEVIRSSKGGLTFKFDFTPFVPTDGSVEEAVFAVLALPTKYNPTFFITLPMLRKALYDVNHGSTESLNPSGGGTYPKSNHYKMRNPVELARWLKAFASGLDEEQKAAVLDYAAKFWNRSGTLQQMWIAQVANSAWQNELLGRTVMGIMTITILKLSLPTEGSGADDRLSSGNLREYMLQHSLHA